MSTPNVRAAQTLPVARVVLPRRAVTGWSCTHRLPWRGRYYLLERPAEQLVIVRSLAEALPLRRPSRVKPQAPSSRLPHQPIYPRGVAALLSDYRLVELAAPAEQPARLAAPAVLQLSPVPASGPDDLVEPLTEREREVLALLAAGCSNREIAEELVLTPGTVKWHAHNLYGKLGVARRTQAIARARVLGLLDDAYTSDAVSPGSSRAAHPYPSVGDTARAVRYPLCQHSLIVEGYDSG
jgi:DNA-binding CsgD family transcriptional regulator